MQLAAHEHGRRQRRRNRYLTTGETRRTTNAKKTGSAGRHSACGSAAGQRATAAALAGPAASALGLQALLHVLKLDLECQRTKESFSATKPASPAPST